MTYLLIQDDGRWSKLDFPAKVQAASEKYQQRFKRQPNICLVNPAMTPHKLVVEAVEVVRDKAIQPGHFWIGEKEKGT